MINQTSIQEIENISFQYFNSENFEQITNQLLNYKIHTLNYLEEAVLESISNLALENISKFNPQELHQLIFLYLKSILILILRLILISI